MHLLKAEGDSTLQILDSCFSFKKDTEMVLPKQTMISSMDWLADGKKVVISGTNMPITVLDLERIEDKGIETYKIGKDDGLAA